jgi:riboflavin kinase/FMN adenylyltransferase
MQIIRHYTNVQDTYRGAVVAIGNFDGVHRGHQAVVARAAAIADELDVPLAVVIFEPHPREYLRPDEPPFRLMSFRDKARMLERLGVDILYVLTFDQHLATMLAQDFVLDVLVNGLGVVHVIVGYDYAFGKGRNGDVNLLSHMAEEEGFGFTVVEPMTLKGGVEVAQEEKAEEKENEVFSSSRIRAHLREGRVRQAADLLGHWWSIEERVQRGDQRGRTIGFPTANLPIENYLIPKLGVYAVQVELEDRDQRGAGRGSDIQIYDGVANVGRRPTFDKKQILLEAHLFNFDGDLYGQHIRVSFIDFIRPEQKFDGLEALKAQIQKDCKTAQGMLDEARPFLRTYEEVLDGIAGHGAR